MRLTGKTSERELYGGLSGELPGEAGGEPIVEGKDGGWITSSNRVWATGRTASNFNAAAASPNVASFLKLAFAGEGLRSILSISAWNALAASSLLPVSKEARP